MPFWDQFPSKKQFFDMWQIPACYHVKAYFRDSNQFPSNNARVAKAIIKNKTENRA